MGELALTEEIKTLGLEKYAEELERDGLTIVPPEVNGFGVDRIDEIVELILARAREMTGCTFTLDGGPQQELEFPKRELTPKQLERGLDADELNRGKPQFIIQKLTQQHRLFRDLALNPASLALQNFMMAGQTRLSSVNCFVKWKGDFGYGPSLGLHADQGHIPTPWGAVAHTPTAPGASPSTRSKAGPWPGFPAHTGRANPRRPRSGSRMPSLPRRRRGRSSCRTAKTRRCIG